MQGCGNDYIYVNAALERIEDPAALSVRLSDRHFGIGADGLVLIMPSDTADFGMRMFNADGSESPMCGNAIRCVGKYVYDMGLTSKLNLDIETGAGLRKLELIKGGDGLICAARVWMGNAAFDAKDIPVLGKESFPVSLEAEGRTYNLFCVSVGNPHAVAVVDNLNSVCVEKAGPVLEKNGVFPQRSNIEFVQVISPEHIRMRVWERGSGETLACGTGACASAAVCNKLRLTSDNVKVELLGGELYIELTADGIYMTGPAVKVFDGQIDI